jgi:hypothetical protein
MHQSDEPVEERFDDLLDDRIAARFAARTSPPASVRSTQFSDDLDEVLVWVTRPEDQLPVEGVQARGTPKMSELP